MKLKNSLLKNALDNLRPIVGRKQSLPILSCVKLHTERNRLHITGSNLDEFMVERVEVEGEFEPTCVSFNFLAMALSGDESEITRDGGSVKIVCGQNETTIATLDAEEFPPLPAFEKPDNHGSACAELHDAICAVAWAASTDLSRYVLQSVLIESTAKSLRAVATNARELAVCDMAIIGSEFSILVPSAFAVNLAEALTRKGAAISSTKSQIKVSHDSGNYYCKQLDGSYPNYIQVIPKDQKLLGIASVEQFKELVASCVGFAAQGEACGVFTFKKSEVEIDFTGDNNARLSRKLAGKFQPFKIALSTRKTLLVMQHVKSENFEMFYSDELSPICIKSGNLSVFSMPMRLK